MSSQELGRVGENRERSVVIVQRYLTHYRIPFFELLKERLGEEGIRLRLLVGNPTGAELLKGDTSSIPWAEPIKNLYWSIGLKQLVWQRFRHDLRSADLVILEQGSRLLSNAPLLLRRRDKGPLVAFWGHGINRDVDDASAVGEWIKGVLTRRCDWFFAYTESVSLDVVRIGMRPSNVSVVQNAVDTDALRKHRASVSLEQVSNMRKSLGIESQQVGLYIGSLYKGKRIETLIEAALKVKDLVPEFHLIIIGDGPDRELVDAAQREHRWIHWLGQMRSQELATASAVARVLLMPGLVGLAILDGFALGLPIVTCPVPNHSPEIDYLVDGVNGLISPTASSQDFASTVVGLLDDQKLYDHLRQGSIDASQKYSTTEMVANFSSGIISCLQIKRGTL